MTMRRLWVLVSRLPPDSNSQAIMSGRPGEGPERAEWSTTNHLLAAIHDQLQYANYLTGAVNSGNKKNPVPEPKPLPRPGLPATPDKPPRRRPPPQPS